MNTPATNLARQPDYPVGSGITILVGEFTAPDASHTVVGHDDDGYLRIFPVFKPYMRRGRLIEPAESRIEPDPGRIHPAPVRAS